MSAQRRWVIGTAIAVVVILAAGWFLLVKPQHAKVTDLHSQTAAQEQTNQTLTTKIAALQAEAKNNAQEQRILEKFVTQIPDTAAEPSLIRTLTQTAKGAGVDLVSITPGAPIAVGAASSAATQSLGSTAASGGSLFKLPLALQITGAYSNVESFFAGLEHLPRAFLVSSFTVAPATSGTGTAHELAPDALTASVTTAVFYSTPSTTAAPTTSIPEGGTSGAGGTGASSPDTTSTTNPAAPATDEARHAAGETS
jgi:Tfp pilus assembly protein PilO